MTQTAKSRVRRAVERIVAASYGATYDAIVASFGPYRALLAEIDDFVKRAARDKAPGEIRVLDVACGTGTVALHLVRRGYSVVGLDAVEPLVRIARERGAGGNGRLTFHHADPTRDTFPGIGTFDVVVSMHTLYWHPDPYALLGACRRALRPGGHALFLTYSRPARVVSTFRRIRAQQGPAAAVVALRWLVPTAAFEMFRGYQPHYMSQLEFHDALTGAGFHILESRRTFLADISLLAWVRTESEPNRRASAHRHTGEVTRPFRPMLGESNSFGLA